MRKFTKKEHAECLLIFSDCKNFTQEQIDEYWNYQANGGDKLINNPLADAQKWKEWYLEHITEEILEWWSYNAGWINPIQRELNLMIEKNILVLIQALKIMIKKINNTGIINFYVTHSTMNMKFYKECIKRKYK